MTDSIGVVIPAYEPDILTLERYIESVRRVLDPVVIRIEIDAPKQATVSRLEEVADVNVSNTQRGKGAAIMEGFDALDTDVIAFADADGSVPATSLSDVVRQVSEGTAEVGIASRRHPSSRIVAHQTVVRRLLGDVFAFAARKMLPTQCRDYQCGAKAVRADAWETIGHHCYEPEFAWDLEFVSVAGSLGYEIAEVPVDWEDHPDSTVNPISTSIELATALVDVKRRTDAIATSPRFRDVTKTDRSKLMKTGSNGE
ncbi:glycosyltransferase [Halopelagius longus]|uniref:Glycosyl transferase family 2 n=1 Tax=Halopelagius longus TaxID=1236180 RepID=A0A1H1C5J5_9EURY|nr:glycosyltransferase [Halopelagius longus]RDI71057.1 glycosyltransferase [Halopelagius longus]SDQ58916.1 Glycosyl transferase family 2 [Halopelagius longus]